VVAAALMHRYRPASDARAETTDPARLRYWKPVQTGIEQDDDTAAVRYLGACGDAEVLSTGVRLHRPVSPHLAARLARQPIDLDTLMNIAHAQPVSDRWIVEGAGGVLVPLNDSTLMADLMSRLRLPAVIVARSTLGTINHTLLTLEALRARAIVVAGIVMVGARDPDNREALESFGKTSVLGELEPLSPLSPAALLHWALERLDPYGRLQGFLR
jgi:dethiobiotin synthase